MKTRLFILALCLTGSLSVGRFRAAAEFEVSAGVTIRVPADFYEPLAARGAWVEVGSRGRCWRPAGVRAGWRPYCDGEWEWTDCGWYWVSDEPWAWACYHYGTWFYDSYYGWVWVPGIEWAPAWVSWRMGGDYVGWAPCGPAGFVVEPSFFVFVESRHFHHHIRPDTVIVNNTTIINRTTQIQNLRREQRQFNGKSQTVIVNDGPRVETMERATGHKFAAVPVQKADQRTFASVPKTFKHRMANPTANEKPLVIPTQPNLAPHHELTPGGHSEMPNHLPPRKEMPGGKVFPPGQAVPQPPPERIVPPGKKELPQQRLLPHPKEVVPPAQPPARPPIPVVPPGNPVPDDKGQGKDKDKDHAQYLVPRYAAPFENLVAHRFVDAQRG